MKQSPFIRRASAVTIALPVSGDCGSGTLGFRYSETLGCYLVPLVAAVAIPLVVAVVPSVAAVAIPLVVAVYPWLLR